jgi:hypothetical protein
VPHFLITYKGPLRGRCTIQVVAGLQPAEAVAKRFAAENHVIVLRCQLLGHETHLHPTSFCIYDSKVPHDTSAMTQSPVKTDDLPEDEGPEEEEEEETEE